MSLKYKINELLNFIQNNIDTSLGNELIAKILDLEKDYYTILANLVEVKFRIDELLNRYLGKKLTYALTSDDEKILNIISHGKYLDELLHEVQDKTSCIYIIKKLKSYGIIDLDIELANDEVRVKIFKKSF